MDQVNVASEKTDSNSIITTKRNNIICKYKKIRKLHHL